MCQRIRYRFSKHETIDQLENVFVFDLETYNDQEFAEAYAAGIYDVNRLRDKWDRDLTLDQTVTEKDSVIVLVDLLKTLSRTCLDRFQRTTNEMKENILIKMGMR